MNMFTIRDDAAKYWLPPFFAKTDAQAIRMFVGSLGDSFPYRADFALYCIGSFDDEKGEVKAERPRVVIGGHSIAETLDPRVNPDREQAQLRGVA